MLLAAFTMLWGSTFAEETVVTWNASTEVSQGFFNVGDDLTLKWEEASGDQAPSYNSSKTAVSMKTNNKVTVAGADANVTISEIVFSFDNSSYPGLSANVGSTSSSYTDNTTTWTGEANSITFTAGGARLIKSIKVTYTGKAATVAKAPVLNITNSNIADTYDMDANSVFVVYYENTGNAAAENAELTLYVDGNANKTESLGQIAMGATGLWKNMKYDLTNLAAGDHQVYLSLTADNADAFTTEAKTVTFTKAAPEATFTVTAENVTVPYDATSFEVKATVTNTSDVAATGVQLLLQRNAQNVVAPQTFDFAANESKEVTFTITAPEGGFTAGTTNYWVYVKAYEKNKATQEVTVTVEEAPFVEKKDLAITEILGTLDLGKTTNDVRISVQNNGNVDITDAPVTLKAGESTLGTATVSATAGQYGWCTIAVASEGLQAGQLAVTATVEVEGDETPADNTMEATLTVNAAAAPEATFTVTAEDVTVPYDATSFEIKATIKNTSEVTANGLTVQLLKGITEVDSKTLNESLAPGAEVEVTFTINEIDKNALKYYVRVGNKAQAEVTVTYAEAPVAQTVDMALTQIQGVSEINLSQENTVMVWYKNEGNVATTATISATLNGTALTAQTVENVAAEVQNYVTFTLPVEGLTAGETATFEATIAAEGDTNAENNTMSKTLNIVSGETNPAAEIAINPISGWEVQAGEQEVSVTVTLFNNGEVEAKDVKVELYKSYGDNLCEPQTVDVPVGEGTNWKNITFRFNYTFEAGKDYEFTAYTNYVDADNSNQMQKFTLTCPVPVADVAIAKIANIEATTEDNVKVNATLKNNSTFAAKEVKVGVYKVEDLEYKLVGIQQTVEEIAAGEEAGVEFSLGQMEAGNYTYYVRILSIDGTTVTTTRDVTIKVSEPVVPVIDVALTQMSLTNGHIDLAAASNILTLWVENKGNVAADATVNVTLNGTALESHSVNLKAGKSNSTLFALPTEDLVAGQKATIVATVNVEDNTSETTTVTKEYDIVDSAVATEPVFEVTAQDVEVEWGAEKFDVVATVKNVSEVNAENITVSLFYNSTIATQTISVLANNETTVTFADVQNPFAKAGEYTMYVQAPKTQAEVKITVKPEPVVPVIDMALTTIHGLGKIDLQAENKVSVWYKNEGNVDVQGVTIKVAVNGSEGETKAINAIVKPEETGYIEFTLPTDGLTASETATVVATVTIEGDANAENNSVEQSYEVVDGTPVEPTFSVTAENVTVEYGAESFNIVATIKNTSEVTANGLTVRLLKGITEVETKTLNESLAAGAEVNVTFTVAGPFEAGTTAYYYVQAAEAQANVEVTFAEEPVQPVIDLAITSISGTPSLDATAYLTVFVENKGNVDVQNATVTLKAGEKLLGTGTVSPKAGGSSFCSIAVAADKLTVGENTFTATVEVEGDVDLTNNTLEKTYTLTAEPVLSFTANDITVGKSDTEIPVAVIVKNTGKGVAKNVAVKVYSEAGAELGLTTIETIAAGGEKTALIMITNTFTDKGKLQIWVAGVDGVKWVNVTVTESTAIAAIKAQYGENVKIYTLTGKLVDNVKKGGLYIVNGKKMVVK